METSLHIPSNQVNAVCQSTPNDQHLAQVSQKFPSLGYRETKALYYEWAASESYGRKHKLSIEKTLVALIDKANIDGVLEINQEHLAKKVRISSRTLRRYLNTLQSQGLITINPGEGWNPTNTMVLNVPELSCQQEDKLSAYDLKERDLIVQSIKPPLKEEVFNNKANIESTNQTYDEYVLATRTSKHASKPSKPTEPPKPSKPEQAEIRAELEQVLKAVPETIGSSVRQDAESGILNNSIVYPKAYFNYLVNKHTNTTNEKAKAYQAASNGIEQTAERLAREAQVMSEAVTGEAGLEWVRKVRAAIRSTN